MIRKTSQSPISNVVLILAMLLSSFASLKPTALVKADHTGNPSSVTLVGSLQSEVSCAGDWDPTCTASYLSYDGGDDVWKGSWNVPAGDTGSYEYKAALNNGWD